MAIDLTGGLGDDLEFVYPARPDDPDLRESVNAWIWDDGDVALPRVGVEAAADQWDTHDVHLNMALAGDRVVSRFGPGPVHDPAGADGRPRILGAGPIAFELVEPFGLLRLRYDGTASLTTVERQLAGAVPGTGDPVDVEIDIELRPAVPPWLNGALLPEAKRVLDTQEEGDLMGHPWRFEQLCRATGRVRVGDEEFTIDGGANRIRRQSVRRFAAFRGHAWQAALFGSGRGFAYIAYPPRADGKATYNEGYLFDGDGELVPARVVDAPWLRDAVAGETDVPCTLQTPDGRTETITGTTVHSTYMKMPREVGGGMQLHQAVARYTWDGEQSTGMIERSTPPDAMS